MIFERFRPKKAAMKRFAGLLFLALLVLGSAACRRSERWEGLIHKWPSDRPTGGTPTEFRQYHEAKDNFHAFMDEQEDTER